MLIHLVLPMLQSYIPVAAESADGATVFLAVWVALVAVIAIVMIIAAIYYASR